MSEFEALSSSGNKRLTPSPAHAPDSVSIRRKRVVVQRGGRADRGSRSRQADRGGRTAIKNPASPHLRSTADSCGRGAESAGPDTDGDRLPRWQGAGGEKARRQAPTLNRGYWRPAAGQ